MTNAEIQTQVAYLTSLIHTAQRIRRYEADAYEIDCLEAALTDWSDRRDALLDELTY